MFKTINTVIKSKTLYGHFIVHLVFILFTCGLIIYAIIPLIFWSLFGEGAAADKYSNTPLVQFIWTIGPLFLCCFLCLTLFRQEIRLKKFSKAKSYLLSTLILLLLYPFRITILDIIVNAVN
jgi:hypothetical protein